ncbi:sterol desaturase family protein [Gammaproteobacteria bacterium]|nr:sterol desaturase family protein [Gammaproteobacteria bacterium]
MQRMSETTIRLSIAIGVLALMALAEWWQPRRRQEIPRVFRWCNNLALVALDSLIVRLVFPLLAVGVATHAAEHGWGVLNQLDWPLWWEVLLSLLVLDLAIYLQHRLFHAVPWLWRLHRVHHSDLEFDASTGLRFHPIEIVVSLGIKMAVVVVIGPPALAVLLFEILLNTTAIFSHANLRLPRTLDRVLRWMVVTPDMHRVHHSIHSEETNSNFGFNLPWWDRVFGTYRRQPRDGHDGMTIGIAQFRQRRELWLHRMLVQPFRRTRGNYRPATNDPPKK